MVVAGVSEERMQLYGETGAQSSIVPAFDAALGIEHEEGWLRDYLHDMRAHMPPAHRAYLGSLEVCIAPGKLHA
jgi:indoleamine 2,3-dioxygenase